ncbi:MAG: proprotein convertase P-domain-containing protein, partial [Bacteroidota bacterium]
MRTSLLHTLCLLCTFILSGLSANGQNCECIGCDKILVGANCDDPFSQCFNTIENDTVTFQYTLEGAEQATLGLGGQGVCRVDVRFKHQLIGDLEVNLISPSGTSVTLIGPQVINGFPTEAAFWNVSFIPCDETPSPDLGFNAKWSNDQNWGFGVFNGSYFPAGNCLEAFNSGPANGTWTLQVIDADQTASVFLGRIFDFSVTLCDIEGIDCFTCEADAGEITNDDVQLCTGDKALNLSIEPNYVDGAPDATEYSYRYVLSQNGTILDFLQTVDLRDSTAGEYEVCGLSIYNEDTTRLTTYLNTNILDFVDSLDAEVLCADISGECISVNILSPPDPLVLTQTICEGGSFDFFGKTYLLPGIYPDTLKAASVNGCDSIGTLILSVNTNGVLDTTVQLCEGDVFDWNDKKFSQDGLFDNVVVPNGAANGCDTILNLNLEVIVNAINDDIIVELCDGDSIEINSVFYDRPGFFRDTVFGAAANGCDSILFVVVRQINPVINLIDTSICAAGSVMINGKIYDAIGSFADTLDNAASNGCDSILLINVGLNTVGDNVSFNEIVCDPLQVGPEVIELTNQFGCDSIVTINRVLGITGETMLQSGTCDPDSVGLRDTVFLQGFQCDSLVITTYTALESSRTERTEITCDPLQVGPEVIELTN